MQSKKPAELYCDYNFDQEVRYFSDFMQSQMSTKMNQMFMPTSNIHEQDFIFFNKGREMWSLSLAFKDEMEDKVRQQLEVSDAIQGFQMYVDSNSGYSSLSSQIITYYLKDESPKSPVFLYSINNDNKVLIEEAASDEDRANLE
jgi:hypothetical protein